MTPRPPRCYDGATKLRGSWPRQRVPAGPEIRAGPESTAHGRTGSVGAMSFLRETRVRARSVVLAMATISVGAIAACVGDSAAPAGNEGTEGNDCFANETCNVGLECYRGRCRTQPVGDAGASSGAPGSSSSSSGAPGSSSSSSGAPGSSSSSGGGGSTIDCGAPPPASPLRAIRCGSSSCDVNAGVRCCEDPDTDAATCVAYGTSCAPSHRDWQCANFENCAAGNVCCLVPLDLSATCPPTAGYGGTRCTTSCPSPEVSLCLNDSHCDEGKTCQPLHIADPDPRVVGACL